MCATGECATCEALRDFDVPQRFLRAASAEPVTWPTCRCGGQLALDLSKPNYPWRCVDCGEEVTR